MMIYVGSLSKEITETDLRNAFKTFGDVAFANIVHGRLDTNPVWFGIVSMLVQEEAQAAIIHLNGTILKGRSIVVHETGNHSR
jgi:RNA recognition motif-containing protein